MRDAVIAYHLGSGRKADIFFAGLKAPNVLQNLLGEGSLSASFIPVYARFLEEGKEEEAGRFAGAVLGLLTVAAFGVALLGMAAAPLIAGILVPRWAPEDQALLASILRILFPMTATLVISAWALGILNSHRRFFVSYVAPVLWNVALVVGAFVAAGAAWPSDDALREGVVRGLAWGGLAGGALQLLVQLPFMGRSLGKIRVSLGRGVSGVREAWRNFVPVVLARGAVNLSALVDVFLAGLLITGAVAHLQRAQTLYLLPIALFGMAVAAAELPELSRSGPEAREALADRVRRALARVRFLLIPSAVAYLLFGDLLVAGLYQRGDFGATDARVVGWVLAAYAVGMPASAASRTLSSAFYALRESRTPARIALVRIVISLGVAAALVFPLDRIRVGEFGVGTAGIGLGASLAAWIEYTLLRRRLAERIGGHGPGAGEGLALLGIAGVAGAAALLARSFVWPAFLPAELGIFGLQAGILVEAMATAGVFGGLYLALARGVMRR